MKKIQILISILAALVITFSILAITATFGVIASPKLIGLIEHYPKLLTGSGLLILFLFFVLRIILRKNNSG
jgi:hypothetical protein